MHNLSRISFSYDFSSEEFTEAHSITSVSAVAHVYDEESNIETKAGYVLMHRIKNAGPDLLDHMDSDGEIHSFTQLIDYEDISQFNKNVKNVLGKNDIETEYFLIFDKAEIQKEFRGSLLALKLIESLLIEFGDFYNCAFLTAQPLQYNKNKQDETMMKEFQKLNENDSRNKLFKYYSEIGFKQIKNTNFMVLDISRYKPRYFNIY